MKKTISEAHVIAALEGYLKMMSMIDDDAIIIDIKRNRSNDYEIEIDLGKD